MMEHAQEDEGDAALERAAKDSKDAIDRLVRGGRVVVGYSVQGDVVNHSSSVQ